MNILIVANHYAACSARYAADAFTRLGHSVKHVGQPMGRNIWGMQVPEQYVWEPDVSARWDDAEEVRWDDGYHEADLAIVMDSDPIVLNGVADWTFTPRIVWGVDNHVRDYRRPYFDHYFLAHKSVSVMPWEWRGDLMRPGDFFPTEKIAMPAPDMTWLPCATDMHAFPPSPIAWAEREFDVCMIGVLYPHRWRLVNAMRAAGLKVLAGTGLVYEAYAAAYHNSRVALVSSACGDLPIRLFEGAGMGCAVLHDVERDLVELDARNPLWEYDTVEVAVNTARYLQDHPLTGEQAWNWAQQHTWDARCQVILDWLEARS